MKPISCRRVGASTTSTTAVLVSLIFMSAATAMSTFSIRAMAASADDNQNIPNSTSSDTSASTKNEAELKDTVKGTTNTFTLRGNLSVGEKVNVSDTDAVVSGIKNMASPPKRGQLESNEEYAARSASIRTLTTYYLVVEGPETGSSDETWETSFTYKDGLLTIHRGEEPSDKTEYRTRSKVVPFVFRRKGRADKYEATNGFGAKVQVTRLDMDDAVLCLTNTNEMEKGQIDYKRHHFSLPYPCSREQARELVRDVDVVVGVQFNGWAKTHEEHTDPKFNDPYDITQRVVMAEAEIQAAYLVRRSTHEVIATYYRSVAAK